MGAQGPQFWTVDERANLAPVGDEFGRISGGIAMLYGVNGSGGACGSRTDADGRRRWDNVDVSGRLLESRMADGYAGVVRDFGTARHDDFGAGLGSFNVRDLTQKLRKAMEEQLPPLQSRQVFSVNTDLSPGILAYEQSRTYGSGQAIVYAGGSGSDIPEVGIGTSTMTSKVVYLVSKATINWLEGLSSAFAGLDTQARKITRMRRVIEELEDKWAFVGNTSLGLYGLLDHPYIDTALSTVAYTDDSAADDIVTDFGSWANYAENESAGTFQYDTLLIAPKLANALRNRRYGDNADKSLMEWMISANPHIKRVESVSRLNDAGGTGIHAFAFMRSNGALPSLEIVKPMTETTLPPDVTALVTSLYTVSGFGGLNQLSAGDNLVVYAQGV